MAAGRHNINGWEGWIHKQGSVVPSWKKRYMVLSGRDVAYYDRDVKDAKAKEKGFFKLVAVYGNNDIENGLILTDDTGKSMNIYTKTRDEFAICYRAMKHAVDQANVKSTPRAPQQPAAPSVQHSGWLEKEGDLVPTWKRRYFYLIDTNLKYFDKPQGGVQKGGGRVIDVSLSDRQYGLSIQLDNGRVLKVVADSEADAQAWYNAVNQALGRPIHEFTARRMSRPPSFRSQAVASPHTGRPMLRSESLSSRQQPADPVSYAGWLTKHNKVSNTWKRRFFMLSDRSLKYYDKPLGGLQKGGGHLTNITIVDYRSFRFELEDNVIVNVVTDELDEVRGWYEACCLALGRSPANVKLPKPIESVVPRQLQEQVLSKPTVPASPVIGARTVKVPFIPATAKVSGVAGTPKSTPAPSPAPKYAQVNDLPPVLDIRSAPPRAPAPTVHTEGTAYSAVSRDPAPSFGSVDGVHLSTIAISNEDRPSMDAIDDDFDMVHYQSSDDQVDEEDFDREDSHSESDAEPSGEYSRGSFASYGHQSPSNQSDLKESQRHSNTKVDASPASKSVQFQAVTLPVIENEDLDAISDAESDVNVSTTSNRQAAIVDVTAKVSISIAKTQDNQVSRNFEANTFVPTSMCTPDKCGPGCSANKSFHGRGRIKPSRPPVAQVHKSIASDNPKISRCTPSKCEPGCKANQTHPRPQVSTKSVYMPAKSSVAAVDKSTGTCSIM
ncbi:unnamed protein product [Aphanomyces euteiches]|uniref:PH domain-containing protein n=1 Tax=Aphanomyces euteiches TaxID=100861 RepID=A0A6G0XB44_9STRA|nr:hypothetical protein Ae201684_006420 [Aphanomyces euteiches]KAH9090953.1 hypothetical protein Ae201684P_006356 [Aphanomyces euteiches]KAH9146423.1 hypothetical protein AeRB84_009683 [Aphanomyces euteiches]